MATDEKGEIAMVRLAKRAALVAVGLVLGAGCVGAEERIASTSAAGFLGQASAYAKLCPSVKPGISMINAAAAVYGEDVDNFPDFEAAFDIQMQAARKMTIENICEEAVRLYGSEGSVAKGYLMPGAAFADLGALIALENPDLPVVDEGEVEVAAAFVFHALNKCENLTSASGFPYMLEERGISLPSITKRGERIPRVLRAYIAIEKWRDWQSMLVGGRATDAFCKIAMTRYGPSGQVVPRLLKEK